MQTHSQAQEVIQKFLVITIRKNENENTLVCKSRTYPNFWSDLKVLFQFIFCLTTKTNPAVGKPTRMFCCKETEQAATATSF